MSINTPWRPFIDSEIEKAPILDGVYGLYDGSETIYYGKGEGEEGIKGRLKWHKAGHGGSCTQRATSFNHEACLKPSQREVELLTEHKRLYGKLPRCNDVTPSYSNF